MSPKAASAALAFALAAAAGFALADDDAPPAPPPLAEMAPSRAAPGWSRQANSLLLYGQDGALSQELPLREPDESALSTRETAGGVAPDGTMAWTLDRRLVWSPGRTKLLESHRALKTYGVAGAELWRDDAADLPERGEPVLFSSDSKLLLLSRRGDEGWTAQTRTWLGQVVATIGPFPRLISMALTPNGRFALVRWGVPDKSDTHTFVDFAAKLRRDVPSSDLVLGLARIGDDGVVRSGSKVVFAFDLAPSTAPAASAPAAPSAQDAAQDEPAATLAEETDPAVIEVRDKLKNDPAFADSVAQRVARSRLIGRLTDDSGEAERLAAAQKWIKDDPAGASHIALGLSSDDLTGTTAYEDALLSQLSKSYDANPGASKNTFGRLSKTAKDSKLLKKQQDGMSDDEKREILRTMFEGQGAETNKVLTDKNENKPSSDKPSAAAFNGIYDRLNAGNLRGYSPQLMSLQSALSARRPPGAPALIETGKLDYPTLSYPAYGMHYDIDNLEKRLRQERILQLAKLAGRTLTADDWKDPTIEAKLASQVPADKLPPRLKRRADLLAKAHAAQAAFVDAAEKAKNPNAITRALLVELGSKQKETARWIADAALEEELSRVDELDGFLTPELRAAVDAAPAPADERASYERRGTALQAKVAKLKGNAVKAQGLLESDGWAAALGDVDKLVAENQELKRTLAGDVKDYARVPFAVAESMLVQPRWRVWLDDLAVKWAPSLSYSRGVALRRGRLSRDMNVFGLIASGDAAGAHAALINETGGR